jgi:hypothetical protein|nr:MAG TPA: hypothetical protein [Caudoviricetes sp.]
MIKKEVTVDGFDGPEKRTYYFHLTRSEVISWVKESGGQLQKDLERVSKLDIEDDLTDLFEMVGRVLHRAVGERAGARFVKNSEIADDFVFSGALDAVLADLLEHPDEIEKFTAGLLPAGVMTEAAKLTA